MHPLRIRRPFVPGAPALALVLAAAVTLAFAPAVRAHGDGTFPRTMNLDWSNNPDALRNSRYDMVALSHRTLATKVDSIHALNPSTKVLLTPGWYVYYNAGPSGYAHQFGPWPTTDPAFGFDRKYWDLLEQNQWWAWSVDSSGVRYHATAFWDMWLGNLSVACPPNAQGKRLCDVFADFLLDELLIPRGAQGVFFDQLWDSPAWLNWAMGGCQTLPDCTVETPGTKHRSAFDLDANFQPDSYDSLDVWWKRGVEIVFARIRERMGNDFVIMGNGQHHYLQANGAMHERFPRIHGAIDPAPNPWNFRWHDAMFGTNGYLSAWHTQFQQPVHNVIDTELSSPSRYQYPTSSTHQQLFRFNLGSTLLGDGYFTMNNGYYGCYFWQPEYDLRLGWPRGPAYKLTFGSAEVWRRDFTNGEVWVNAKDAPLTAGASNPAVPGWDARILITADTIDVTPLPRAGIVLAGGQPNPFGPGGTSLTFALEAGERAALEILDLRGRRVRALWNGAGTGAPQTALWDGRSEEGWLAPPGIYFARLEGEGGRRAQSKLVRVP